MSAGSIEDDGFSAEVIQIRHDLRGSLGHIMGFSELLLDAARKRGYEESLADLGFMEKESERMNDLINGRLDPVLLRRGGGELAGLVDTLIRFAREIRSRVGALGIHAKERQDEHFVVDLERIDSSAVRIGELVHGALSSLRDRVGREGWGEV